MSNPLSNELFFDAHRGMKVHSGNQFKINENALGMHWSADERVAKLFGNIEQTPYLTHVYHAKIPMSSVETQTSRLQERQVAPKSREQEIPVKEGAPVYVTGKSTFNKRDSGKIRKRTKHFNPPREMKA